MIVKNIFTTNQKRLIMKDIGEWGVKFIMNINFFEHRKKIAQNLISFIGMKGYSKLSLSKLTGISRPTIDQILKAESPSQTTYNSQIRKIITTFDLPENYFITLTQNIPEQTPSLAYAYSDHGADLEKNAVAQELLDGLDNILDIYSMYLK